MSDWPAAGLYVTQAVALVSAMLVAGLAMYAVHPGAGAAPVFARTTVVLAVVAFAAALVTLPFAIMTVAGDGVHGLADGLARADVLRSGDYESVLARATGLVAVVAALRAGTDRGRALLVGGGLLVAGSFALTGHLRSHGPAWAMLPAALAHVIAAAAWIGGLTGLAITLPRFRHDALATGRLLLAFARMMTVVLALLVAAGIGLAVVCLPTPGALVHTAYGQVLLLKVGLVAALLIVSSANHLRLVPLSARGDGSALRALRTNIAVEQLALVAVLVITAILGRQNPAV